MPAPRSIADDAEASRARAMPEKLREAPTAIENADEARWDWHEESGHR